MDDLAVRTFRPPADGQSGNIDDPYLAAVHDLKLEFRLQ